MEDIRYFLEEYKPKSADPNITCFKELTMQGYQIKSKSFSEIMDNYFQELEHTQISRHKKQKIYLNLYISSFSYGESILLAE